MGSNGALIICDGFRFLTIFVVLQLSRAMSHSGRFGFLLFMKAIVFPTLLHAGEVHTTDISLDGAYVLTGGSDGAVSVYKYADFMSFDMSKTCSLTPTKTIKLDSTVTVGRFCPTDSTMAVGTIHGSIYLVGENTLDCIFPLSKWNVAQSTDKVNIDHSSEAPNDKSPKINQDTEKLTLHGLEKTPEITNSTDKTEKSPPRKPSHPSISTPNILDVAWSPDGRLIAWISAFEVHIHDRSKNTYQTLISSKPNSSPRSIAFDPTSSFFVCLGDDTVIDIYRYHYKDDMYQFKHFTTNSRMANAVPNIVDYRRISWSPDGEYVSVPTASKGQTSLVSLISRSSQWSTKVSLVGHDTCCEVVCFNPTIYAWDGGEKSDPPPAEQPIVPNAQPTNNDSQDNNSDQDRPHYVYNIVATAGSDMTLSIWNTIKEKPLLLLKDIAKKPISDLVWHPNGRSLLQSSMDGHVTLYNFEEHELGNSAEETIKNQLLEFSKKVIHPFEYSQPVEGTKKPPPPVIIDQRNATEQNLKPDQEPESITEEIPTTENKSKKEKQVPEDEDIRPVILEPSTSTDASQHSFSNDSPIIKRSKPTSREPAKLPKQKVSTKDGKKRIQPMLISLTNGSSSTTPLSPNGHDMWNSNTPSLPMEYEKPSYAVADSVSRKRPKNDDSTKKKRELEPIKFIGSQLQNPNTAFAAIRLAVPKVRLSFQIEQNSSAFLDVKNGSGNESTPTRITYLRNDRQLWTDFIPRYILLATKGTNFWATATADGEIYTYLLESGKRIFPPIVLGSAISFLESHEQFLLAITSVGELYVWDLNEKKIVLHSPQSIKALLDLSSKYEEDGLSKSENITMCSVTSKGIPLITLSSGSGYLFNKDLGVWHIVTESWWAFGSHYWDSLAQNRNQPDSAKQEESIIALLEQKTNEEILRKSRTGRGKFMNKISKNMIMKEGFENLENSISINHLENRMLASELLGEKDDFHAFFLTYVRRISELGLKAQLLGICSELYGPEDMKLNGWKPTICEWDKRALLKELVLTCAKYRNVQRILVHYAEKIGVVAEMYG